VLLLLYCENNFGYRSKTWANRRRWQRQRSSRHPSSRRSSAKHRLRQCNRYTILTRKRWHI